MKLTSRKTEIRHQVWDWGQIVVQVCVQVRVRVTNQVVGKVWHQVSDEVWDQICIKIKQLTQTHI